MNIGNKERHLKFGLNQSILYCELRGVTITQMNKEMSMLATDSGGILRDLVWSALKDGARVAGDRFEYTNFEVGDWLEVITEEGIKEFIDAMTATLPTVKDEDKKKQASKKKSTSSQLKSS